MKIFISQPMNGRTDEVIKAEREYIADKISAYYMERNQKESIEVIDSFFRRYSERCKAVVVPWQEFGTSEYGRRSCFRSWMGECAWVCY